MNVAFGHLYFESGVLVGPRDPWSPAGEACRLALGAWSLVVPGDLVARPGGSCRRAQGLL